MGKMDKRPGWKRKHADAALAILAVSAVMEILLWARINLKYQYIFDYDASKLFYHVICMWREKHILIPGWDYMTTGEWDCASFLALPFYGLTGDIKRAFGMANLCNVLLFSLVVTRLFRAVPEEHGRKKAMLLAICLLLMPYCWGMLDYANMLFYGGAQYIYKVLLPVWLISLYVGMPSRRIPAVLWTAAFLAVVFATASSSGLYVLMCGLFPVLCCRLIRAVGARKRHLDGRGLAISLLTVLVFLAGFAFQRIAGLDTKADAMTLITLDALLPNVLQVVKDFLGVMRVVPRQVSLEIFSPQTIISYLKIGTLLVMIALGTGELSQCFMLKAGVSEPERLEEDECFVSASLGSIFVWNLLILTLTETTARYHLIGFVPFMMLACMALARKLEACSLSRLRRFLWTSVAAAVLLFAALLFWDARDQVTDEKERYCQMVISEAARQSVQTVVLLDDGWLTEEIRPLDPERNYVTYFSSEQKLMNYDVPVSLNDMRLLDERHMLVAQTRYPIERLPESMRERYTLIKDEWESQYYIAEAAANSSH